MDDFFNKKRCDRCHGPLDGGFTMSRFNTDTICMKCAGEERQHPDYRLAADADAVSLHIPDTPKNRRFLNAERLAALPPRAVVINTARGAVLDENALFDAVSAGRIAGAGLDVFIAEPYAPQDPARDLRRLDTVVMTPHLAGNTAESCRRVAERVMKNLRCAAQGDRAGMDLVS